MLRRIFMATVVVVLGTSLATPATAESMALKWKGKLWAVNGDGALGHQVRGVRPAWIKRDDDKVAFWLEGRHLGPRHAYTNWLSVYNFPEFCTDPDPDRGWRCGAGDFGNALAGHSVMWGTGGVSRPDGFGVFSGERRAFDPDGVLIGPGLIDPEGAEIHIIVRDHGPASDDPETREQQTTTLDGNCSNPHFAGLRGEPGDYECGDPMATGL